MASSRRMLRFSPKSMATTWKRGALLPSIAFAPTPFGLVPAIALAAGDVLGEIEPDHAGEGRRLALQRREIEAAGRIVGDHRVRHALLADQRRQRPGIDAGDGDDAAGFQPIVEVLAGAIVRWLGDVGAEHAAAHARRGGEARRLDVVGVGADIADMGEGEGDDLPGIGRIGQDLLIAGHRRVEADLAHRNAGGARALAFDHVPSAARATPCPLLPSLVLPTAMPTAPRPCLRSPCRRRARAAPSASLRPTPRLAARTGRGPLRPDLGGDRSSAFVVAAGRAGRGSKSAASLARVKARRGQASNELMSYGTARSRSRRRVKYFAVKTMAYEAEIPCLDNASRLR